MTTLITGATGFIGKKLMQPDFRALVRKPAGFRNEVVGDLSDPKSLQRVCDDVNLIFHCAGYAHAAGSESTKFHHNINYVGVKNLLDIAGRAGVKHFIFLSSVKAMAEPQGECVDEDWPGMPSSPYGLAKRAAENAVFEAGIKFGMHVVNLRLSMVYGQGGSGNLTRMAQAIRAGWFPPLPETGHKRSLIHVKDVIEAMHLVANRPESNLKTYIVADPVAYSGREIYLAIRDALGMSAEPYFNIPVSWFAAARKLGGQFSEVVDRLIGPACYSPTRIESDLGWRARIGLNEGLREMLSNSGAKA